jgi:hypothetical protein
MPLCLEPFRLVIGLHAAVSCEPEARKTLAWSENSRTPSPHPHSTLTRVLEGREKPSSPLGSRHDLNAPFSHPSRALAGFDERDASGSGGSRSPSLASPPAVFRRASGSMNAASSPNVEIHPFPGCGWAFQIVRRVWAPGQVADDSVHPRCSILNHPASSPAAHPSLAPASSG